MRRLIVLAAVSAVLPLTSCTGGEPVVMPDVVGKQLDVAKSDVKRAGFDDDVEVVGGGMFGVVVESNWTVCSQEPSGGKEISDAPRLVVDRSCDDEGEPTADAPSSELSEAQESQSEAAATEGSETAEPDDAQVLTVATSPDLAALLKLDNYCAGSIGRFAKEYRDSIIQFDGSIENVLRYGAKYDVLLGPGNEGPRTTVGPAFKFERVTLVDMNFATAAPNRLRNGDLLRVQAEVGQYNPTQCLFYLTPVSTKVR